MDKKIKLIKSNLKNLCLYVFEDKIKEITKDEVINCSDGLSGVEMPNGEYLNDVVPPLVPKKTTNLQKNDDVIKFKKPTFSSVKKNPKCSAHRKDIILKEDEISDPDDDGISVHKEESEYLKSIEDESDLRLLNKEMDRLKSAKDPVKLKNNRMLYKKRKTKDEIVL